MSRPLLGTAVLLGRLGDRQPRQSALRHVVLTLATLGLGLSLGALVLAGGVLDGIAARDAARSPQTEGAHQVGYWLDTFSAPPLHVVLVQPADATRDTDTPPPGLPRWPHPGEAFVSPEVAHRYAVGTGSPWGRVVGTIGAGGLVNPNEQYVLADPAEYHLSQDAAVYGWGTEAGFSGDHASNLPTRDFLLLVTLLLVLPALFAALVAARLDSSRTRAALDVFAGLGAGRRFHAVVGAAAVARPAAIACLIMWACLGAAWLPAQIPLPGLGTIVQHTDIAAVASMLVAAPPVAAAVVVAASVWNHRPRTRRTSAAFTTKAGRPHPRVALLAPTALLIFFFLRRLTFLPIAVVSVVAMLAVALFCFSAPFAATWIVGIGARIVQRSPRPLSLTAARFCTASLRNAQVLAVGLVSAVMLFGTVDLYSGYYGAEARQADEADAFVADRVLVAQTPSSPAWTAERLERVFAQAGVRFVPEVIPDGQGADHLSATCSDLELLGARSCSPAITRVADLNSPLLDAGAPYLPSGVKVADTAASVRSTRFLAVGADGQPLDRAALAAAGFSRQVRFRQVGGEVGGMAAFQHHQLRWPLAFVLPGIALLMFGLLLGAWPGVTRRMASLRPFLTWEPGPRFLWAVSAGVLWLPLLISTVVAVAAYVSLGLVLGEAYDGLHPSPAYAGSILLAGTGAATALWLLLMLATTTPRALQTLRTGETS